MSESDKKFPAQANEPITTMVGFQALVLFMEAFWNRDGRPDDSLMKLLSWISPVDEANAPADPAMWKDWLDAIECARNKSKISSE